MCGLVWLQERIPRKTTCLKKKLGLCAQYVINILKVNIIGRGGGRGATWPSNDHENLDFNNESNIHMNFTDHEKPYDDSFDLEELLTISY